MLSNSKAEEITPNIIKELIKYPHRIKKLKASDKYIVAKCLLNDSIDDNKWKRDIENLKENNVYKYFLLKNHDKKSILDKSIDWESTAIINTYQITPAKKPLQHPRRSLYFVGRESQIEKILAELQPGRTITICGPAGVGKTALASEIIHRLAPSNELPELFHDGILFYSFYSQPDTNQALEAIARKLGYEPKPNPVDAAFNALSGKQILLVLDGAEEADDLSKMLRVAGRCGILITTRNRQDAIEYCENIAPLDMDDSVRLLRFLGKDKLEDEKTVKRICKIVECLPLALQLIGHYINNTPGETGALPIC